MARAEAEELVASALALAAARDGSSGGLLRMVTVSAAGAERRLIPGDQVGCLPGFRQVCGHVSVRVRHVEERPWRCD